MEETKNNEPSLIMSTDSNINIDFEPISAQIDESGKVVYRLGHYLARHF